MLFLLFHLGAARYALDTAAVLEIVPRVALKPVLCAPAGVAGLLDYHAAPVPVLDLGELATGEPTPTRFSTRLILVRVPDERAGGGPLAIIGLLAERATTLLQREPGDFARTGLNVSDSPYLGPVTADAEGFIHRVRVDGLLTGPVRALLAASAEERRP